jgi:GLPGLI family protein
MKNHIQKISAMSFFLFLALGAFAQDNYTIKMTLKIEGLPAEYAAYGDQDITTYIKGDKLKTERSGMMMTNTTFYDGQKMTSLTDAMGNKTAFTASKAELESTEKPEKASKTKIDYTNEKKTIAGYECSKALITTTSEGKESQSTVWYSDQI